MAHGIALPARQVDRLYDVRARGEQLGELHRRRAFGPGVGPQDGDGLVELAAPLQQTG
jgi:hypothetical protein